MDKDKLEKAEKIMKEWAEVIAQMNEILVNRMPDVMQDWARELDQGHKSPTKSEILYLELRRQNNELQTRADKLQREFEIAEKSL